MAKKRETSSARQERLEAIRRQQQRAERRRLLIGTCVVIVVLAALVVGVVVGISSNKKKPATAGDQIVPAAATGGSTTTQPMPKKVENKSGIDGVVAYDTQGWPGDGKDHDGALGHDHVSGPVKYAVLPPVGGPHNGVWMNAGVYTEPIPNERAVHNLEHGAIWITYRPNLSATKVRQLQDLVGKQSMIDEGNSNANRFMDLSPWSSNDLSSPIVVSAWGYQLKVDSPSDPRIQKFIDKFRHNQTYTPEYGSAVDGIPVETGGRPAKYGSKFANPSGSAGDGGM